MIGKLLYKLIKKESEKEFGRTPRLDGEPDKNWELQSLIEDFRYQSKRLNELEEKLNILAQKEGKRFIRKNFDLVDKDSKEYGVNSLDQGCGQTGY